MGVEDDLQPASAGARTTADCFTGTTPRGGIGERPALESRRLARWFLMPNPPTPNDVLVTIHEQKMIATTTITFARRDGRVVCGMGGYGGM